MCGAQKICGKFFAIHPDLNNLKKVSRDLRYRGRYADNFRISSLGEQVCGKYLSNKFVI